MGEHCRVTKHWGCCPLSVFVRSYRIYVGHGLGGMKDVLRGMQDGGQTRLQGTVGCFCSLFFVFFWRMEPSY